MARVRFDTLRNTCKTIPRNIYQKWWKPDNVPFQQLLLRRRDLDRLTTEEIDELLAYYAERNAKREMPAPVNNSINTICTLLDRHPNLNSEALGRLLKLHQLVKVID